MRDPAVAGQFYPGDKKSLLRDLDEMIPHGADKIDAVGAVAPHAGYMYSGKVAGEVYSRLKPKETYIILSPNHTGYGARFASSAEKWRTPLGDVDIDLGLLDAITANTDLIKEDASAHVMEHSCEVQVPFIQKISPRSKILPITVQMGTIEELTSIAGAIARGIGETKRGATIIASSDMTHYESRQMAKEKDYKAIQAVLDLDAEGLLKTVSKYNISMCGCIPTAIMIMCANKMGAEHSELIKYSDSGDVTGDTQQVVGYAGIIVY